MTRFLLDRDVLSAAENPSGNRHVHAWIAGVPDGDLYISVVTVIARAGEFATEGRFKSPPEAD